MLSFIIFFPLVGALLVLFAGGRGDNHEREPLVRTIALAASLVTFVATLVLWWRFDPTVAAYQFEERHAWIPVFGIQYYLGVDGISLLLIVLTGFLTPLALLSSWESVHKSVKAFSFFMLALETAMLGVFASIDLFLFYIFWDAMLIPMYFLIGVWGYERRIYAAVKFILYTMAGSVLMLIAIIGLAWAHQDVTGSPSFNLLDLYNVQLSTQTQSWFFLAFALAFLIKVPLFPFHTWLPDAHVEAPTAGSVILAGVMLKMGTYGLLRFAFPLFPEAAHNFAPFIGLLAVVGIIYGALVAMVQPDMKKLVAYSSVSHLGFVVLGLCAMNVQGVQGALYRHALRSPAHAPHLGVRRAEGRRPSIRRGLPARDAVVNRAAGDERIRRRVPDPDRRLPLAPAADRLRRVRRDSVGGLHALDVPAGQLRTHHKREEPIAPRSVAARVGADDSHDRHRDRDGRRPRLLPAADGACGLPRRRACDRSQAGARLERAATAYEHAGAGRAGRFPGTPDAERRQS